MPHNKLAPLDVAPQRRLPKTLCEFASYLYCNYNVVYEGYHLWMGWGQEQGYFRKRDVFVPTVTTMRDEYDFSEAKPNPYAKALKRQVTIRLDKPTIEYFKKLSEEVGVPYQSLINLYLRDCAISEKKLEMKWTS